MLVNAKLIEESDLQGIEKILSDQISPTWSRLLTQIKDSCTDNLKYGVMATKRNGVIGFAIFKKLSWDTEHFGINIGRVSELVSHGGYEEALAAYDAMLKFIGERCVEEEVICIYCRTDINDSPSIHSLESNGFKIIDILTTLRFDFGKNLTLGKLPEEYSILKRKDGITVRAWKEEDLEELSKIATTSYEYDRFHSDLMFPKDKSDELHGKWIVNCCRGLTDEVLVATLDKPMGFITCKIDDSTGVIDMVCVSKNAQRKGIGDMLVHEALEWLKDRVDSVDIGTQNRNIPAIRLYLNAGFRPVATRLTFHKWFIKPDNRG